MSIDNRGNALHQLSDMPINLMALRVFFGCGHADDVPTEVKHAVLTTKPPKVSVDYFKPPPINLAYPEKDGTHQLADRRGWVIQNLKGDVSIVTGHAYWSPTSKGARKTSANYLGDKPKREQVIERKHAWWLMRLDTGEFSVINQQWLKKRKIGCDYRGFLRAERNQNT
jgi:hypothetical protein